MIPSSGINLGRHARLSPLAGLFVLLGATATAAQLAPASPVTQRGASVLTRDAQGQVIIRATRMARPLRVDGRLDEEIYNEVAPITEFLQQVPKQGAPVSEKTEMWVLFDDKNIYISCRLWDEHPERIVANDMRRDSPNQGSQQDRCDFGLDTLHDKRSGYQFTVTPLGGMRDGAVTDEIINFDWNGVWTASATRFEHGWLSESAIPFKSLRYQPGREQIWGIQLRRGIRRKNEQAYVTPVPASWGSGGMNHMSAWATLVGIEAPLAARNIDIKPYAISRVTTNLTVQPNVRNDVQPDGGIDVKYGLTKSLTASFSYRTDFAEAEADDAQVNLTRFSLFFPEKREFFLEGQGLFQFGVGGGAGTGVAPTIFYSRRIGLNGAHVVPVIGGARLAGRAGAWTLGALNMETDSDVSSGAVRTNFTALRLRHDIFRRSNIGGIFTRRSISLVAPGANTVMGLDANFSFYQNVYFTGYVARSLTDGRHGDDLSYRGQFNYTGDRYGLQFDRNVVEQNFNPEVGFLPRTNFRRTFASARFSPRTRNNPLVRKYTFQADLDYITDNDNRLATRLQTGMFETEFHNSDIVTLQVVRDYEFFAVPFQISRNVRLPVRGYSFQNMVLSYAAGTQRRLSGTSSVEIGSFYDGDKKTVAFKGRASMTPQFSVEPNISLNWINLLEGDFTTTLIGAATVFSMTPRRFIAALIQRNSSTSSLSVNMRFRWEYEPGSELFVVYTEGRSTLPAPGSQLQSRGLVVKINHLFRL